MTWGSRGMHQGRVGLAAHGHVAGQQQSDLRFDLEGLVGQLGVAGPKDHIGLGVVAEFLLEGGLDVDLGQGAEPWAPKASLTLATAS
jgi:hypothetical protein